MCKKVLDLLLYFISNMWTFFIWFLVKLKRMTQSILFVVVAADDIYWLEKSSFLSWNFSLSNVLVGLLHWHWEPKWNTYAFFFFLLNKYISTTSQILNYFKLQNIHLKQLSDLHNAVPKAFTILSLSAFGLRIYVRQYMLGGSVT